jgi:glycosyltransferase involved in cell wall biosynthesis
LKISIITPSLNAGRYIEEAIRSVLLQRYGDFEHIVKDGGSTDSTLEILKRYPHLKWISEPDRGQSNAMNVAFSMSSGDIIGYLNADDYYLPGAFAAVMPRFQKGKNFVLGKIEVINDDGTSWINDAKTEHMEMLRHWEPQAFCVNPVGYFYRREVQEKVGGFNEMNTFSMDLEFLLAASKQFRITKIDQMLGVFRYIRGTKTAVNQKDKKTWTTETYPFIDQYLSGMPRETVDQFMKDRREGYLLRQKWQKEEIHLATMGEYRRVAEARQVSRYAWAVRAFLNCPDKTKLIRQWLR